MDPITVTLLFLAATGITVRAAGGGVAHAAAAIKGRSSPTVQKWEAREAARRARGEKPRQRPGALRTSWDNALSEWSEKQGHKHLGRMEAIREMSADTQAKERDKLLRKAQRRATLAGTVSKWGDHSKDGLQKVSADLRQVLDDKRASRAVRRGEAEPELTEEERQQQAIDVVVGVDNRQGEDTGEEQDAVVIPLRRSDIAGNPGDPATWTGTDSLGRDIQTGHGESTSGGDAHGQWVVHDSDMYLPWDQLSPERRVVIQEQCRKEREQEESAVAVQSVDEAEREANWIRGNHRRIPEWSDEANQTWEKWHRGAITDAERDAVLARLAGISPDLASMYRLDAEDFSDWSSSARYVPGEEMEALYGHRTDYPKRSHSAASKPEQNTTTTDNANTGTTGGSDMTQTQTIEITDLASGIQYASTVGGHLGRLGAKLGEDAQIAQNNAAALREQMQVLEDGQGALAELGFEGGQIQNGLAEAAELVPESAQKLQDIASRLPEIGEQLEQVKTAMDTVKAALEAQRSISEELDAKRSTEGVAASTKFYQEA